jgi:putative flippase GtrA
MVNFQFFIKLFKFGLVGFSGVFIDFSVTYLFKEVFKIKKYISNSIGFSIAASSNYLFNRLWTFNSSNPSVLIEFSKFFIIALIGLGLNNLLIYIFNDLKFKLNFYLSKIIATLIVFLWNFLMNYFFTF